MNLRKLALHAERRFLGVARSMDGQGVTAVDKAWFALVLQASRKNSVAAINVGCEGGKRL